MAASSITLHSPTASDLQTTANSSSPKSFLSRCIEDLSPSKVSSLTIQSKLWLVAAGVTFVAYTGIAAAGFVIAGVLAPAYAPFVAIGALLLVAPVANFMKNLLLYADNSEKEANKYLAIQQHYKGLSIQTPLQIFANLRDRGINWIQIPGQDLASPEKIATLNPLLAHAQFLDDKIQKELGLRDSLSLEAKKLAIANFSENRSQIYDLRNAALFAEDRAMETKVEAAFVNAVLRKGDHNGSLDDVASLTRIAYQERILANELNDSSGTNEFLTFKNRNLTPITFNDVKNMTVSDLGQRLFAALN